MPPSLINFDKKEPENQVINFAWPNIFIIIFVIVQKTRVLIRCIMIALFLPDISIGGLGP